MAKNIKKSSLEYAIRETASSGKPYGCNELTDERAALHVDICKKIVAYMENNKLPLYAVAFVAMSQGSFRWANYRKGWTKFNEKKANTIAKWYKSYNDRNIGGGSKDVVLAVLDKFYQCVSKADNVFYAHLKTANVLGKYDGNGHGDFKAMCRNLGIVLEEDKTAA